jgi:hypothetical protein
MLTPSDKDIMSLLRTIRTELAQDRSDIQRLQRVFRREEFAEYPIPELEMAEASSSASSSSSSSSSSWVCFGCEIPLPLTMTVTNINAGTVFPTREWYALEGTHTLDIPWRAAPNRFYILSSSCIYSSYYSLYLRPGLDCWAGIFYPIWRAYSSSSCGTSGASFQTTGVTNHTSTCDPFYTSGNYAPTVGQPGYNSSVPNWLIEISE